MAGLLSAGVMQSSGLLVAEAPSLNEDPIQVSRPQLVLGNYPPTPDDLAVRSKSLYADAAPPPPPTSQPSLPPSIVQYFRWAWLLLLCCTLLMVWYVNWCYVHHVSCHCVGKSTCMCQCMIACDNHCILVAIGNKPCRAIMLVDHMCSSTSWISNTSAQ